MYDAALGGKDNFQADQDLLKQVLDNFPTALSGAQALRQWMSRATRFLVGTVGVEQFLDCGYGLPTEENTHDLVQRINPEAKVVYLGDDTAVAAYGRALLEENDYIRCVLADPVQPGILRLPEVTQHLDFDRPIAVLQGNTVHHVEDDERTYAAMASFVADLPSGSYLALSHLHNPHDGSSISDMAEGLEVILRQNLGSSRLRSKEQVATYFDGLELVEPGLVKAFQWWPDGPRTTPPPVPEHLVLTGLGRKP